MISRTVWHSAQDLSNRQISQIFRNWQFSYIPDFIIKEELLDLVALQESTRAVDIKNSLDSIMKTFDVPLNKLVSIATDRAPAMLGKKIGLIWLLRDDS